MDSGNGPMDRILRLPPGRGLAGPRSISNGVDCPVQFRFYSDDHPARSVSQSKGGGGDYTQTNRAGARSADRHASNSAACCFACFGCRCPFDRQSLSEILTGAGFGSVFTVRRADGLSMGQCSKADERNARAPQSPRWLKGSILNSRESRDPGSPLPLPSDHLHPGTSLALTTAALHRRLSVSDGPDFAIL